MMIDDIDDNDIVMMIMQLKSVMDEVVVQKIKQGLEKIKQGLGEVVVQRILNNRAWKRLNRA